MNVPEFTAAEVNAAYQRGAAHGYDLGLRDGRMTPQELAQQHLRMKTWVPKRRTDPQAQEHHL